MKEDKQQPESSSTSSSPTTTTPIPVDRQWIAKLLQKYPNPNSIFPHKALVVAPMVDQSDLPFRLLARKYGSTLCFTPMIHSRLLVTSKAYQKKFLGTWPMADRPLIAQLCGSDPEMVLQAAKLLEPHVDGIDINCGCPQGIAKRGNYGAFLLEQEETLLTLVRYLVQHLQVPLSVKVRLLPDPNHNLVVHQSNRNDRNGDNDDDDDDDVNDGDDRWDIPKRSLELYTKLVDAGVHLLTIHGRTRHQKAHSIGHSDWETIRKAVDLLGHRIPIFANGSIETHLDVEECLRITNADGVMSSESILEYPPLFYSVPQYPIRTIGRIQLAKEYMALAKQYPPHLGGQGSDLKCVRIHVHRFLHADLQVDTQLRQVLVDAEDVDVLEQAIDAAQLYHDNHNIQVEEERLSWYRRHRIEQQQSKSLTAAEEAKGMETKEEEEEEEGCCGLFDVDSADADY